MTNLFHSRNLNFTANISLSTKHSYACPQQISIIFLFPGYICLSRSVIELENEVERRSLEVPTFKTKTNHAVKLLVYSVMIE